VDYWRDESGARHLHLGPVYANASPKPRK